MSGVQRAVCNHLPQLRAESDGEGTLHFDERRRKKKCGHSDERLCLRACMPSCVVFFFPLKAR